MIDIIGDNVLTTYQEKCCFFPCDIEQTKVLNTLPTDEISSGQNAWAKVSIVSYLKNE